jgi:hypothetical protein
MDNVHEKKTELIQLVQTYFDECQRINEVNIQHKCETDLERRKLIATMKSQESIITQNNSTISGLESEILKRDKQIHEYSELIKNLEDKVHELSLEKKEEERFDMVRMQADNILKKEEEIERLTKLLHNKNKSKSPTKNDSEKKVLSVIDLIEKDVSDEDISITVIKNNDEEKKEEQSEEDDEYEILTYRKKEYWIKKEEDPQCVYEVLVDDGLGSRLGIYKKDPKGKMKVFLDK